MTFQHLAPRLGRAVRAWWRAQFSLAALDNLDADYRDWRPEGPIWERLIR